MGNPIVNVTPPLLGLSSGVEAGISAAQGGSVAGGSAALVGVLPMAPDITSVAFADALRIAGAAYVAAMTEHVVQRGMFAGAQGLMAATFETTETIRAAAATLDSAL